MGKEYRITMVGDIEARRMISGIAERARRPALAMKVIADLMRRDVLDHFDAESGPDGSWPSLSPGAEAWKAAHGYYKMLQNTGNLRRGNFPEAGSDYAAVTNNVAYAGRHNAGLGGMPQREFMWLSPAALLRIKDLLGKFLAGGM